MDEQILLRITEALESIARSLNEMADDGITVNDAIISEPVTVTTAKHDFVAVKAEII